MTTSTPIGYGAIGTSNLDISQTSSGDIFVVGTTQFARVQAFASNPSLSLTGQTVLSSITTVVAYSTGSLTISANTLEGFIPAISSYGSLTISAYSFTEEVANGVSSGFLDLRGTTDLAKTIGIDSNGDLVLDGSTEYKQIFHYEGNIELDLSAESTAELDETDFSNIYLTLRGSTDNSRTFDISSAGYFTLRATTAPIDIEIETSPSTLELDGSTEVELIIDSTRSVALELRGSTVSRYVFDTAETIELDVDATTDTNYIVDSISAGTLEISGATEIVESDDIFSNSSFVLRGRSEFNYNIIITSDGTLEISAVSDPIEIENIISGSAIQLTGTTETQAIFTPSTNTAFTIRGATDTISIVDSISSSELELSADTYLNKVIDIRSTPALVISATSSPIEIDVETSPSNFILLGSSEFETDLAEYTDAELYIAGPSKFAITYNLGSNGELALDSSIATELDIVAVSRGNLLIDATATVTIFDDNILSDASITMSGTTATQIEVDIDSAAAHEISGSTQVDYIDADTSYGQLYIYNDSEYMVQVAPRSTGTLVVAGPSGFKTTLVKSSAGSLSISASTAFEHDHIETSNISTTLRGSSSYENTAVEISVDGLLSIAGSTALRRTVAEPSNTGSLSIGSTFSSNITIAAASRASLTLRAHTDSEAISAPGVVTAVNSFGTLILSGSTDLHTIVLNIISETSSGSLTLAATGSYDIQAGVAYDRTSTGSLTISAAKSTQIDIEATSTGALVIAGTTGLNQLVDQSVTSTGTLAISGSTATNRLFAIRSAANVVITSDTTVVTRLYTRIAVNSDGFLELDISDEYELPAIIKPHGAISTKSSVLDESRQIAFHSHVRTGKIRARSQANFYPAPPLVEMPKATAEAPRRALGELGQFLEKFQNRLVYSYDSTTETISFRPQSEVLLDTTVSKAIKRRGEEELLLGLDEETLLMDSARLWELFDNQEAEQQARKRREREELDLLGIDD
jgi:hypothetical protein